MSVVMQAELDRFYGRATQVLQRRQENHGIEWLKHLAASLSQQDLNYVSAIYTTGGPDAVGAFVKARGAPPEAVYALDAAFQHANGSLNTVVSYFQSDMQADLQSMRQAGIDATIEQFNPQSGDSRALAALKANSPLLDLARDPAIQQKAADVCDALGIPIEPGTSPLHALMPTLRGLSENPAEEFNGSRFDEAGINAALFCQANKIQVPVGESPVRWLQETDSPQVQKAAKKLCEAKGIAIPKFTSPMRALWPSLRGGEKWTEEKALAGIAELAGDRPETMKDLLELIGDADLQHSWIERRTQSAADRYKRSAAADVDSRWSKERSALLDKERNGKNKLRKTLEAKFDELDRPDRAPTVAHTERKSAPELRREALSRGYDAIENDEPLPTSEPEPETNSRRDALSAAYDQLDSEEDVTE